VDRIAEQEWWLTWPLVALLALPLRRAVLGLLWLPVLWLVRWLAFRHPTRRTPVDWPIFGLLFMVPIGCWASVDHALTVQSVIQLLVGIGLFYALVNWAGLDCRRLAWGVAVFVGLGVGLAAIAPLATRWNAAKVFSLPQVYHHFRQVLPETANANVLAGGIVLVLPTTVALTIAPRLPNWGRLRGGWFRFPLALAAAAQLSILLLSQSRGAWMAATASLGVVLMLRWPFLLWLTPAVMPGSIVIMWRIGFRHIADLVLTTGALGGLEGRLEVWSRALYAISDFVFTGIGLGTFGRVIPLLYPYFLIAPDASVPHAHNLLLQVAVDLGLPGLIAYLALLLLMLYMAVVNIRHYRAAGDGSLWALSLGLLGSLVALLGHGMTDAVTWGTKPAFIQWLVLGLIVVAYEHTRH